MRSLETNLAKVIGIDGLANERLSNFVRFCSDVEGHGRCQHLTNAFGGLMGTLGIVCMSHYDDDATISHNNENLNSLRASSPFKEYREKSRASGTQNKTREQDAGKENESSWFPPPLTTSPLTCTFACHSKWIGCSRSITFLVNRTRSLFDKSVYVENSDEKFELFTY